MPLNARIALSKYPFVRILAALAGGIVMEWYVQFSIILLLILFGIFSVALSCFTLLPITKKYTFHWLQGFLILIIIATSGSTLTYLKDIRNQTSWYGNVQPKANAYLVSLKETPEEKPKSFKVTGSVDAVSINGDWKKTSGKILLYFQKNNFQKNITYGSQIIFSKPLQEIKNTGNPGAFDYNRYCLFQDITAQVYLKNTDYKILPDLKKDCLEQLLINTRNGTLNILKNNIKSEKELGVAEALLIGYRFDLDKDLVQAYSNTGVIHIVAISGLHLGMIYGMLTAIFSYFKKYRLTKLIRPIAILGVLWMFTLVAGAAPSIMRSAVMFSFIVLGEILNRKTNMYNTLAASAFCMLIANPFTLWDVGFLLSYAAVVSIVTFMKPVYKLLTFPNKILDKIWSLTSVTISAQVLTIPIVIYYFHQFPNLFLITNLFAVPLSGFILYGEILLLIISPFSTIAAWLGGMLQAMISTMNNFIERVNYLPFAVWSDLQLSVLQTWLLYGIIISLCTWLVQKSKPAFVTACGCFTLFTMALSLDFVSRNGQQQLLVYNVPNMSAIDLIEGHYYRFTGDSTLSADGALVNFYLRPSRVLNRCIAARQPQSLPVNKLLTINNKRFIIIDNNFKPPYNYDGSKISVDLLIVSQNPPVNVSRLSNVFNVSQLVLDGSNPLWKTGLWKKGCDSLHLRFHSTTGNGAYVMEL